MGITGHDVYPMHKAGKLQEINDYCRCDVLDTYFVFLRTRVLQGKLKLDEEQRLVAETRSWLEVRATATPVYAHYLEHWGEWRAPQD